MEPEIARIVALVRGNLYGPFYEQSGLKFERGSIIFREELVDG